MLMELEGDCVDLPMFQILMDGLRLEHLLGFAVRKPVRQAADMRRETSTRFRPASYHTTAAAAAAAAQ